MKTTVLGLTLCALLSGVAGADEIHVPGNDPTKGGGNAWPWYARTSAEWHYQLFFTAQQMQFKAGVIRDIAFAPTTSGTHTSAKFEMTFSHTTLTGLVKTWASNLPNPVVVLPEGPLTWKPVKDTWSPVGLKSMFTYDGKSNLVVDLRYFGGTLGGGFGGVCHSDSNWNATIRRSWDNTVGAYTGKTAIAWNANGGLITRFTIDVVVIRGSGTPRPGGTIAFDLHAPADPNLLYQVGSSLGTGPIPIGSRVLRLTPDGLLVASVGGTLPFIFQNYSGRLDASGKAKAALHLVNDARLVGIRIHTAFLTLDPKAPFGIGSIADPFSFSVTR
jgi:hypothetical protein